MKHPNVYTMQQNDALVVVVPYIQIIYFVGMLWPIDACINTKSDKSKQSYITYDEPLNEPLKAKNRHLSLL